MVKRKLEDEAQINMELIEKADQRSNNNMTE